MWLSFRLFHGDEMAKMLCVNGCLIVINCGFVGEMRLLHGAEMVVFIVDFGG